MKHFITYILITVAIITAACSSREKEAAAVLEHAQELFERNEWPSAKNEVDSIRVKYPREVKVLKDALVLMRQIEMKEVERNIIYCDSLLPIRQAEAAEASKDFVFEKDSAYEQTGTYIRQQQTVERNIERSYIRCGVNEYGEMYVASIYFGNRPIRHTGIKVSTKDGVFTQTDSIAYDGGLNYSFQDNGNTSEILQYKGERGVDVIKFIFSNAKERLRVDYTGGAKYSLYMSEADKQAVVYTYNLAAILSDIRNLTNERAKAIKRKEYIEGKLNQ
ncbi:MAG: hypothetical protein LBJ58_00100 [Tannerellaceae bacterium]|jgi:hypothetical protein|nr:hypothetical protein [Tannerellaceae bacterium]